MSDAEPGRAIAAAEALGLQHTVTRHGPVQTRQLVEASGATVADVTGARG